MAIPRPRSEAIEAVPQILRVVATHASGLWVSTRSGPSEPRHVRNALPPGVDARSGDEVVVLATAEGEVAVARVRTGAEAAPTLTDGTHVVVDQAGGRVRVQRRDGSVLFDYRADEGHGVITLSNESMRVSAEAGDLSLAAAGEIRLQSRTLCAQTSAGEDAATLRLGPRGAELSADTLALEARRSLSLDAERTRVRGGEIEADVGRAVLRLERLERMADVVVTRARNAYERVEELLQQQAGTLRTLVSGSAQLRAREVAHRAEAAYKVRADKIHLG
jgi:hypothetical protein